MINDILRPKNTIDTQIEVKWPQGGGRLAKTSRDNFESTWNRQTGGQADGRTGPRIESG